MIEREKERENEKRGTREGQRDKGNERQRYRNSDRDTEIESAPANFRSQLIALTLWKASAEFQPGHGLEGGPSLRVGWMLDAYCRCTEEARDRF